MSGERDGADLNAEASAALYYALDRPSRRVKEFAGDLDVSRKTVHGWRSGHSTTPVGALKRAVELYRDARCKDALTPDGYLLVEDIQLDPFQERFPEQHLVEVLKAHARAEKAANRSVESIIKMLQDGKLDVADGPLLAELRDRRAQEHRLERTVDLLIDQVIRQSKPRNPPAIKKGPGS